MGLWYFGLLAIGTTLAIFLRGGRVLLCRVCRLVCGPGRGRLKLLEVAIENVRRFVSQVGFVASYAKVDGGARGFYFSSRSAVRLDALRRVGNVLSNYVRSECCLRYISKEKPGIANSPLPYRSRCWKR
jgi:hypothetical protein